MRKSFCTMDQLKKIVRDCHFTFYSSMHVVSLRNFNIEYMGSDVIYLSMKSQNKIVEIRPICSCFGNLNENVSVTVFDVLDGYLCFYMTMTLHNRNS